MAVITYKCPNCDGGLIFDPESQKFHCEYCLSYFSEEELRNNAPASENEAKASEQAQEAQVTQEAPNTSVIYTCPSCGAEVVTDETTAATFCFYCLNPVVLSGRAWSV